MELTSITVGNYKVLSSGSFFSIDSTDVTFEIDAVMKVILKFTDNDNDTLDIKMELSNPNEITFNLTNFKSVLGTEITAPVDLGVYEGKRLLFHFRVTGMSNTQNKLISYTFLQGGGATRG